MFSLRTIATAAAITAAISIATSPVLADDWYTAMERHETAAEENKSEAREDAQWGFTLSTVMSDVEWRKETAAALRNQPRPTVTPQTQRYRQLVDEAEPRRLSAF